MDSNKILCHNIRFLRTQRHMTQEELAYRAHLSTNEIGKIERNLISPRLVVVDRLAAAFEVEVAQLIDRHLDPRADFPSSGESAQEIAREIAELTPAQKHIVMDLVQSLRRHGTL